MDQRSGPDIGGRRFNSAKFVRRLAMGLGLFVVMACGNDGYTSCDNGCKPKSHPFPIVISPDMTLATIVPNTVVRPATGTLDLPVTLTGSGFPATGVSVFLNTTGVTATNTVRVSATEITAILKIPSTAPAGSHTVQVFASGAVTNSLPFTITAPTGPTLTSVAPNSGAPNANVPVVLTGTGFGANTTVQISGTGVSHNNTAAVQNATTINATFSISGTATPGVRNVTVTTPQGTTTALPFTVTGGTGGGVPTIISVTPNEIGFGTTPVVIVGTNFTADATVQITGSIPFSNVTFVSPTEITMNVDLLGTFAPGQRDVTVTTPAGTSNTKAIFIVN